MQGFVSAESTSTKVAPGHELGLLPALRRLDHPVRRNSSRLQASFQVVARVVRRGVGDELVQGRLVLLPVFDRVKPGVRCKAFAPQRLRQRGELGVVVDLDRNPRIVALHRVRPVRRNGGVNISSALERATVDRCLQHSVSDVRNGRFHLREVD